MAERVVAGVKLGVLLGGAHFTALDRPQPPFKKFTHISKMCKINAIRGRANILQPTTFTPAPAPAPPPVYNFIKAKQRTHFTLSNIKLATKFSH